MTDMTGEGAMTATILVTGGTGFIGSHTCVELLAAGFEVVIVDNLSNSRRSVGGRIEKIAGRGVRFVQADIRDRVLLRSVFAEQPIDAVMHFAGLKAVGDSLARPLAYYANNVGGSATLLEVMREAGVRRIVFSSSATVYGAGKPPPYREEDALGPANPYGRSKLIIEWMLGDLAAAEPDCHVVVLRYFNPIGAHPSGMIGEDPASVPDNLLPYVSQVAAGNREELSIFGSDYPTRDGTGVRDYVHVADLALGHVAALRAMERLPPLSVFNLGTGRGCSVLEVVAAFERVSGRKIRCRIAPRRPGDVAASYADPSRAAVDLGWRARRELEDMCRDTWRWQQWQAEHAAEL